MVVIRIFPRKTALTPEDTLSFYPEGRKPKTGWMPPIPVEYFNGDTSIHISVTFTHDLPQAERIAQSLTGICQGTSVTLGGPATGVRGEAFTPGLYLKEGCTITSRGCPNKCWFCSVWRREGGIRELPIKEGWNILDDNLLACSESHIRAVFDMLSLQSERPVFTGGLEASLIKPWHIEELVRIRTQRMYFAYDTADDLEPLSVLAKPLKDSGLMSGHKIGVYCLIGFPGDTIPEASVRLLDVYKLGYTPYAMLWQDETGVSDKEWRGFQRVWARPICIYRKAWPKKNRVSFSKTRAK